LTTHSPIFRSRKENSLLLFAQSTIFRGNIGVEIYLKTIFKKSALAQRKCDVFISDYRVDLLEAQNEKNVILKILQEQRNLSSSIGLNIFLQFNNHTHILAH
jgi:hypothetical protein